MALISGVSTSRVAVHPGRGCAATCRPARPRPSAAQTPSFHGRPGRHHRPGRDAQPPPACTACQTSTYGCPVTSTYGEVTAADDPALLGARHQVVDEHAEPSRRARARSRAPPRRARRCRPAARPPRPRSAGRRPRSARPARRRGCPRPRSGWPWPPGRADVVHRDRTGRGDRRRAAGTAARAGRRSVTGSPSSRNAAGCSGKLRRLPCRSSSTTAPDSNPTTAPQNPESASSTTRSGSASTSGTVRAAVRQICRIAARPPPYMPRHG